MKEYNFRAWDKYNKRMHYGVEFGIYEDPDTNIDFGTVLELVRFIVTQYSGLKDSNGKKIYNGDRLYDSHHEMIGKVTFDEGKFLYECGNIVEDLYEVHQTVEVVGNIFENKDPELDHDTVIYISHKIVSKCILMVDGEYYGYDNDPAYPETLYKSKEKAYVFESKASALDIVSFHPGKEFRILPAD